MSRILVVGINYAPETIGTGKYTSGMCEWLVQQGHTVRVVTAPPYYPAWSVWPEHRTWGIRSENLNGVEVLRCPVWVPKKPRGLTRLMHLASFALSSLGGLALSAGFRPDLVINIAPTLASAPSAWAFARLSRAKCWLHIQDFEVDAAMHMGIVNVGRLRRAALAAEQWLLRRFDRVSTISTRMLERLTDKGVASGNQVLFPNWTDIVAINPLNAPSPYRAELGIPDGAIVALYSGNMGHKQGLELLGKVARALKDEPALHFVFGGEGPGQAGLEAACQGLPNVHFLGLQPAERLSDWLGLADVHLLPQLADAADLVMPSKLTGMLASGRPILATAAQGTGIAQMLVESGAITEPGNVSQFGHALKALMNDPVRRRNLGEAARHQAEGELSAHAVLSHFHAAVMELAGDANATSRSSCSQHLQGPRGSTKRAAGLAE